MTKRLGVHLCRAAHYTVHAFAVANTAWQRQKAAEANSSDLHSEMAPQSGQSSQLFAVNAGQNPESVPNDATKSEFR